MARDVTYRVPFRPCRRCCRTCRRRRSPRAQVERVRVSVEIVRPVMVRQASGIEQGRDSHRPQVTRRGREVLYEFE